MVRLLAVCRDYRRQQFDGVIQVIQHMANVIVGSTVLNVVESPSGYSERFGHVLGLGSEDHGQTLDLARFF